MSNDNGEKNKEGEKSALHEFKHTPFLAATFLQLCLAEVAMSGYQGSSMKYTSWKKVIDGINEEFDILFDQKQLKNRWDNERRKYTLWRTVIGKTGGGVNLLCAEIHWLDHVWDDIILSDQFEYYRMEKEAKKEEETTAKKAKEAYSVPECIAAVGMLKTIGSIIDSVARKAMPKLITSIMGKLRDLFIITVVVLLLLIKRKRRIQNSRRKRPKLCISSLTGNLLAQETLRGPSTQLHQSFRMEKVVFIELCEHFRERGWLKRSKHITLEEKMMTFLLTVSHGHTNRMLKWKFQHSGSTISYVFHEVLWAMLKFSKEMIVPPSWNAQAGEIRHYRHLREGAFKGAAGALDGTLISAYVPPDKAIPFLARGAKDCWKAVLGICDFDMKFVYVVAGWEGTAHDSRVLTSAVRNPAMKFPLPPRDKYYLCDTTRGFMSRYRNTRYWLADWHRQGGRPTNKKEKFNHAHAHLRNVVERSFGVLKARFPILKKMSAFSFPTQ